MEYIGSYFVYFSILILSVLCGHKIERSRTKREEHNFRVLLFLVLCVPAVLRYNIGTDYPQYALIYDFISDVDSGKIEIGYRWLCVLLNKLGADSFWMFFVMSILTYAPFCFGTPRDMMKGCTFMFVCAFYLNSYSLIRQAVAISFLLYATFQLLEGRGAKFLLFVLIASLFHRSALLILPFYFLRKQAEKPVVVIGCCVVALFIMLSANIVEAIFGNQLFMNSSYGRYAESDFAQETEMGTGLGVLSRMALPILALCMVKQLREGENKEQFKNTGFIALMCIACVVAMYLATRIHIFNRLGDLFRFVSILCMGIVAAHTRFQFKKGILACFAFVYILLFLFDMIRCVQMIGFPGGLGIMPYQTIFEKMF